MATGLLLGIHSQGAAAVVSSNLLSFESEFDNAYWSKMNVTVTANNTAAPDATITADKIIEAVTAGDKLIYKDGILIPTASTAYTFSVYAKAAERTELWLYFQTNGGPNVSGFAKYDLTNGTMPSSGGNLPSFSVACTSQGNGWYKCAMNFTCTSAASGYVDMTVANAGTTGTSGFYLWKAELIKN